MIGVYNFILLQSLIHDLDSRFSVALKSEGSLLYPNWKCLPTLV